MIFGTRKKIIIVLLCSFYLVVFMLSPNWYQVTKYNLINYRPLTAIFKPLRNVSNSLPVRINITKSPHDPSLQLQKMFVNKNSNKSIDLYPWVALCDERDDGFDKAVVIMVLAPVIIARIPQIKAYEMLSCQAFDKNMEIIKKGFEVSRVFSVSPITGLALICPFPRNIECPNFVSMIANGSKITNLLRVERQSHESLKVSKPSFAVCLPPMTNSIATVSPSRISEYLEYNKLIGVSQIYLTFLDPSVYPTELSENLQRVLGFYEKQGLLTKYKVAAIVEAKREMLYRSVANLAILHLAHCVIKNSFKYDYIIVQDLDEAIGFNHKRFSSLAEAVNATRRSFGRKYTKFMIRDTPFDHHCIKSAPPLNYSRFVISEGVYNFKTSLNMGKTVHDTRSCLMPFAHYCILNRDVHFLNSSDAVGRAPAEQNSEKIGTVLNLNTGRLKPQILKSFHFRVPYSHTGNPVSFVKDEATWCNRSNIQKLDWLSPVAEVLQNNSKSVLSRLKIPF